MPSAENKLELVSASEDPMPVNKNVRPQGLTILRGRRQLCVEHVGIALNGASASIDIAYRGHTSGPSFLCNYSKFWGSPLRSDTSKAAHRDRLMPAQVIERLEGVLLKRFFRERILGI